MLPVPENGPKAGEPEGISFCIYFSIFDSNSARLDAFAAYLSHLFNSSGLVISASSKGCLLLIHLDFYINQIPGNILCRFFFQSLSPFLFVQESVEKGINGHRIRKLLCKNSESGISVDSIGFYIHSKVAILPNKRESLAELPE